MASDIFVWSLVLKSNAKTLWKKTQTSKASKPRMHLFVCVFTTLLDFLAQGLQFCHASLVVNPAQDLLVHNKHCCNASSSLSTTMCVQSFKLASTGAAELVLHQALGLEPSLLHIRQSPSLVVDFRMEQNSNRR